MRPGVTSEGHTREIDVSDYVRILMRRKAVVIITVLLVVAVSAGLSLLQEPVYRATTEVLVEPQAGTLTVDPQNADFRDRARDIQNEIEFVRSDDVRREAEKKLGYAGGVSVSSTEGADLLVFTASDTDPERAAGTANTYAEVYLRLRKERQVADYLDTADVIQASIDDLREERAELLQPLEELDDEIAAAPPEEVVRLENLRNAAEMRLSSRREALELSIANLEDTKRTLQVSSQLAGSAQIKTRAEPPSEPVSPNIERSIIVGVALGLLVGLGLAFLFERLDDSLKSKQDLERATGATVLGLIPRVSEWRDPEHAEVVSILRPTSPPAEAYRTLRTSLQFLNLDNPCRMIMFTSPNPGEGKTTTIANLGVALARAGERVLMVCCDLRRPRIHEFFGLDNAVGFTSVLLGDVELDKAIQRVEGEPRLMLLPSGRVPPNPSELLSTQRTAALLESFRDVADIILVDSPPVLPVTDGLIVSSSVDGVILVATSRTTTKKQAHRAWELLTQVQAPVVGTVLNGVSSQGTYGYGNYYGYAYQPTRNGRNGAEDRRSRVRRERRLNGRAEVIEEARDQPVEAKPGADRP